MTRDDIIRLAREAGWTQYSLLHAVEVQRLETFAALIAAAEREACAKVAESYEPRCESCPSGVSNAIRARGEEQPYATQAAIVESQTHGRMQINPATGNVSIGAIRARGEE